MSAAGSRVQFWNHLLTAAELIDALPGSESDPVVMALLMEQLETISEAFGDTADPVENFEEFVVIKLSQAIHAALCSQQR
ncbi:MAG: hypothetical protein V4751_01790 [Pseudomonadota bacterium]